jgi:Xaa-Pro dipeptidase
MTQSRYDHLQNLMAENQLDMLVLNPGPTLTYLTGLQFHLFERPTLLWIKPGKPSALILPELEVGKAKSSLIPLKLFPFSDDPSTWQSVFQQAADFIQPGDHIIGMEPNRLRMLEYQYLQQAAPHVKVVSATEILTLLRAQKDAEEIANIHQAVRIAELAFLEFIKNIHPGITERQAAAELSIQLLRAGSDGKLPFEPIIGSGPNSADPHAFPSDRKLTAGDLVVVDWGAFYKGYCSDLTRVLVLPPVPETFYQIHQIAVQANETGRATAKPGIACSLPNQAAHDLIQQKGYGEYFTHRVGHGIGMEEHEPPYLNATNTELFQPGMVFTIEPGIYLPGQGGVRIEDDVVITQHGAETLSTLSRDLYVIK